MNALRLDLRQIEYFRAVIVTGTGIAAATLLNVSQQNVSRVLKHAEARLGLRLFELCKGRLETIPEAVALYSELLSLHQHLEPFQESVRRVAAGARRLFPLGASPSLGRHVILTVLSALRASYPRLSFKFDILSVSQVIDFLTFGQGECACTIFPIEHPMLRTLAEQPGRWCASCRGPIGWPGSRRSALISCWPNL